MYFPEKNLLQSEGVLKKISNFVFHMVEHQVVSVRLFVRYLFRYVEKRKK